MDKPIFIVGFMGSGKTTWGRKIASSLGLPFIDLDFEIVQFIGMTIPAYFNTYGEEAFRELEREFLKKQAGRQAVVSTGGGTPCYFDNMKWMKENGLVVYLYHSPKSLWSRLSKSDVHKRPVLSGLTGDDLLSFIEAKLGEREPYYEQSQIKIDQVHTPLKEVTQRIKTYVDK